MVECLRRNGVDFTVFFSNSNIYPEEEYLKRRDELGRFLRGEGVPLVEDVYDHADWRRAVKGLEREPERGGRCSVCFGYRLGRAVRYAEREGFGLVATTLASSRWKTQAQVDNAGLRATKGVANVTYWARNWRRAGLQLRRGELIRFLGLYNQNYCGCEFAPGKGKDAGSA